MAKSTNWKWKAAGIIAALFLFSIAFVFTSSGQNWVKSKIDEAYEALPPEDRRVSPWADRYLSLAWFKGSIAGRDDEAMQMYRDFCGLLPDAHGQDVFSDPRHKLHGKCSEDGKFGWGPLHPRAPEAFWEYLQTGYPLKSGEVTAKECEKYYDLFYDWMIRNSPEREPHPLFNKYWMKIREMMSNLNRYFPQRILVGAPKAKPYLEGKD